MTNDSPLPSAAPISPVRAAKPRRTLRFAAVAALVAGVAATGAIVAIAQPGQATEVTAHATLANAEALPAEVTVGADAIAEAKSALATADKASEAAASSVSTEKLDKTANALADYAELSREDVVGLAASTTEQAEAVTQQTAEAKKRAAEAKKKAAAEKKAAEKAAAAAAAKIEAARTPAGAQEAARAIAANEFGWGGDQFGCVYNLWQKESGWNYQATNAGSGAYGIVQSLPGSKMASVGADWQTNPLTQIRWGLGYIRDAYGTPCAAWGHSQAMNWY